MGKPLIRSSLVQAAILPIRLAIGGESRTNIISLLQSPYYGIWATQRHKLATLDSKWRKDNLTGNIQKLINSIKQEYPTEAMVLNNLQVTLTPLSSVGYKHKVKEWNMIIHDIWGKLGFPVLGR